MYEQDWMCCTLSWLALHGAKQLTEIVFRLPRRGVRQRRGPLNAWALSLSVPRKSHADHRGIARNIFRHSVFESLILRRPSRPISPWAIFGFMAWLPEQRAVVARCSGPDDPLGDFGPTVAVEPTEAQFPRAASRGGFLFFVERMEQPPLLAAEVLHAICIRCPICLGISGRNQCKGNRQDAALLCSMFTSWIWLSLADDYIGRDKQWAIGATHQTCT